MRCIQREEMWLLFLMCCAESCVAQVGSSPSFSPLFEYRRKSVWEMSTWGAMRVREKSWWHVWVFSRSLVQSRATVDFCFGTCTFILLCLRPVYVYFYLPSSYSTVSKGMKDVLVPTPPTQQKKTVSHFVFQGQRDAWGDLRLIFANTRCVTSPLYIYIFVSKCQRSQGDTEHSLWFQLQFFTQLAQNTQQTDACFQWLHGD